MRDVTRRGFLKGLIATATLAAAETTGLGAITRLRVADDPKILAGDILHQSTYTPQWAANLHSWSFREGRGCYEYNVLIDETAFGDPDALEQIIDFHEKDAIWKINDMRMRNA
jgi:hypothetical protein